MYNIMLNKKSEVECALNALVKRAAKKGLPELKYSFGKAFVQKERIIHPKYGMGFYLDIEVERIPLIIEGTPQFSGWSFIATIEHLDRDNIVIHSIKQDDNDKIDLKKYVHSNCEHCNSNRQRNETYILKNKEEVKQVGSTCLKDFLGTDKAIDIAQSAMMISLMHSIAESGEEYKEGKSNYTRLENYLSKVVYIINKHGWISNSKARTSDCASTSELANSLELSQSQLRLCDVDNQLVADSINWCSNLTDEEVENSEDVYLNNIRSIARIGIVSNRSSGFAASIITAYKNFLRKQESIISEFIGKEKEKVTMEVTLKNMIGFETMYGFSTIYIFEKDGNILTWKTTSSVNISKSDIGSICKLTGTIKAHNIYKGNKQTELTRCKVEKI